MSWFAAIERSYWPLNAPPSSRSCSTLFDSFSARPGAAKATTTFFPLQVIVCDFPYLSCPTLKSPPSMLPYETPPRISLGNDNHAIPQCSKSFDCKLNLFVALCTSFILSKYSSIFSSEECALVLSSPPLLLSLWNFLWCVCCLCCLVRSFSPSMKLFALSSLDWMLLWLIVRAHRC